MACLDSPNWLSHPGIVLLDCTDAPFRLGVELRPADADLIGLEGQTNLRAIPVSFDPDLPADGAHLVIDR